MPHDVSAGTQPQSSTEFDSDSPSDLVARLVAATIRVSVNARKASTVPHDVSAGTQPQSSTEFDSDSPSDLAARLVAELRARIEELETEIESWRESASKHLIEHTCRRRDGSA